MRLAQRLLLGSAFVIIILVVLIVALSGARLRAELETLETAQLTREARLIAQQWTPSVDPDALAGTAGAALGHRVTLIDPEGHVVGDSEFRGATRLGLQNHATRPEVMAAERGAIGSSHRVSPSRGDEELYVAVKTPLGVARVSIATTELDQIIQRATSDVLLSAMVALAAAMLLAAAFSRSVSQSVVELRDVARALAAGDLSRRPALTAPGEVGDLATAVHRMAEQLDSRLHALQAEEVFTAAVIESLHEGVIAVDSRRRVVRLNTSARRMLRLDDPLPFPADQLPRDRTLRETLATALAGETTEPVELALDGRTLALTARPLRDGGAVLALLDLTGTRRLETVRRDFVANVSHELKTPLTVISGFAETLDADDLPLAQRRQFAAAIRASAHRLQQLVDDLLDLSRIESGGWRPMPVRTDAGAAAAETLEAARSGADAKGVRLGVAIDPAGASVNADPTALRQVLTNLVANGVRYTDRGGCVTVFTESGERGVWIGVRDTGIGIAAEHLPRIFERFYRADSARTREAGGTGLGLAIVRHLVEAHGGRVSAESAPGRGTTVRAFFPDAPPSSG